MFLARHRDLPCNEVQFTAKTTHIGWAQARDLPSLINISIYHYFQRQSILVHTHTRLLMAECAKRQISTVEVEVARVNKMMVQNNKNI